MFDFNFQSFSFQVSQKSRPSMWAPCSHFSKSDNSTLANLVYSVYKHNKRHFFLFRPAKGEENIKEFSLSKIFCPVRQWKQKNMPKVKLFRIFDGISIKKIYK